MAHQAHVIWRRETQSGLKQSPARVLFDKRAPAVGYLKEHPTRYPTAALIYFCTKPEPFDIKTASREPNRTRINLQHQVGKIIYFLV